MGDIELDPPVDEWKDIVRIPDLTVNIRGSFDNFARDRGFNNPNITSIPLGTEWNEWQDAWTEIQQCKIKVGILSEVPQWDKQEQVFVQLLYL